MQKPDVDSIEGLSPAISIEQKTTSRNPRSTVGTVTEIYDYLRLLYARIGKPHCPQCGTPLPEDAPAGNCPRCLISVVLTAGAVLAAGLAAVAAPALRAARVDPIEVLRQD